MKLMVQIGDEVLPLAQCFWIRISPDGCVCSSSYGDTAVTAEAAHKDFIPKARDRDRELRGGWRVRLVTKAQWKEQAEPCLMGTCQHRQEAAA